MSALSMVEAFVGIGVVVLVGGMWLYEQVRAVLEPSPKERLDQQFRDDEISHAEYERRVELLLDDEADRIRSLVEGVNGIGPKTSRDIALAFNSVDELRRADRADLEAIHGVGESTAAAILEEVG